MFDPFCRLRCAACCGVLGLSLSLTAASLQAAAAEPPALNPFGETPSEREDASPGYIELSDGSIHFGQVYLTRDKRLQVADEKMERQREIPLRVIKKVECKVKKEWMEKEWKFKELAKDEKMFTGREYPSREYSHTITLQDGRTIEGPLSGVVYVQPPSFDPSKPRTAQPLVEPERYLLHKRDKGEIDTDLKSLLYVKSIKLGEDALKEGMQKAGRKGAAGDKTTKTPKTKKTRPAGEG